MFDLEEYDKLPNGCIFRTGMISNTPSGIFMTRDDTIPLLKFVLVKENEHFWSGFLGMPGHSDDYLLKHGDRIPFLQIKKVLHCSEEIEKKYYY